MKTIKIKLGKDGTVKVNGSKSFRPQELIETMMEALAYEICRLKKPNADIDDLYIAASSALGAAIDSHYEEMCTKEWLIKWEVV
jgi:hypothetical protein